MKGKKTGFMKLAVTGVICLFTAFFLMPMINSEATARKPVCEPKATMYFENWNYKGRKYVGFTGQNYIFIGNMDKDAQILDLKSSNRQIEAYAKGGASNAIALRSKAKRMKNGAKTVVSFTVKQTDGTEYDLQCTVTFKKNANMMKSIKIGNRNYVSKIKRNRNNEASIKVATKSKKIKIKVAAKDGYKIARIEKLYSKPGWTKSIAKVIKNGSYVNTKNLEGITVYFYKEIPKYFALPLVEGNKTMKTMLANMMQYRQKYYEIKFQGD